MVAMVSWWVYCVVVSALLGASAASGEAALRAVGRSGRWVWLAALGGSAALPLGAWLGWRRGGAAAELTEGMPFLPNVLRLPEIVAVPGGAGWVDGAVVVVCALVSAGVGVMLAFSAFRLRRERAGWREEAVEGRPVLVSADVGPAALGVFRGAIVLPEWALRLESRMKRLMVLHEEEHLLAGDPRSLAAGLAALVALAWNPVAWWQFRRLRQAIELDCDARVLGRIPDARSYGFLLLEVGRRRSAAGWAVAGLAESTSFLERRIRMMGSDRIERRPGRMVLAGVLALVLGIGACEAPEPTVGFTEVEAGTLARADVLEGEAGFAPFTPAMTPPSLINSKEVAQALHRHYPPLLRDAGIGGTVGVLYWIDEAGRVARTELAETSGHPALDEAALRVAEVLEFTPARKEGEPVGVVVSIPISFRTQ